VARQSQHAAHADALGCALEALNRATAHAWSEGTPEEVLANAVPYMQAAGHIVIAWMWLDVALAASRALAGGVRGAPADGCRGLLQACRYFVEYELPKVDAWLDVVASRNPTCREMRDEWFRT